MRSRGRLRAGRGKIYFSTTGAISMLERVASGGALLRLLAGHQAARWRLSWRFSEATSDRKATFSAVANIQRRPM